MMRAGLRRGDSVALPLWLDPRGRPLGLAFVPIAHGAGLVVTCTCTW